MRTSSRRKSSRKVVYLRKSSNPKKKFMVYIDPPGKTVHFGAAGMSDYTKHKDKERMRRYSGRHRKRESWNCSAITTAGFWSKNLLWNKPSLGGSKKDIASKCGVTFKSGWKEKRRTSR